MVEIRDKERYFSLIKDFDYIPFSQTEAWYNFYNVRKPLNARFFVDDETSPEIAFMGIEKKIAGINMLFLEGECFGKLPVDNKKMKLFFESLGSIGYHIIEMDSCLIYDPNYEIGIRRGGFLRPVGLFSASFSTLVHLNKSVQFDKNWHQNLKKSDKANLKFELSSSISDEQIYIFFELYQEMLSRKGFGDSTQIEQFQQLVNQPEFSCSTVRNSDDKIICMVLFHQRRSQCVDLYRVTTPEARENGASFFIYRELFSALSKLKFESYDMGRLAPSVHSKDAVFKFKSGVKGEYVVYNGEWAWYRFSILRPLMYFVKRFLMKRIEV
ncbi:MAG: hypothetical protein ACOYOT_02220 [Bacteroidales bacterium]